MRLTEKQLEIMDVLWESTAPLTITDIVEKTRDTRSWSSKSIYSLIEQLEKKGAVCVSRSCPTNANYAKAYEAAISCPEFMVKTAVGINKARKPGVRVSADVYVETIRSMEDEWEDE